jgi:polysaccharide export outer membrane protein
LKKKIFKQVVKKALFFCFILAIISSCIPNEKVILVQNKDDDPALGLDTLIYTPREEYRLQPRDLVSITFYSNIEEAIAPYRQVTNDFLVSLGRAGGANSAIAGSQFLVDNNGFININTIEPLLAKGLTTRELKDSLEEKIRVEEGVLDIDINVSLASIRYTTIGSIGTGEKVIQGSEANILEAIANAGDISIQGDRQHIQIIRTYPDGLKFHEIDITDRKILQSKFFFIKPGDIIYVPPLKLREIGTGDSFTSQIGTVISVISSLLFFVALVRR